MLKVLSIYNDFIFNVKDRYQVIYGGAGSGKSVACTQKLIYYSCMYPGFQTLVLRKVAATLKNSVYELFLTLLSEQEMFKTMKITISPMRIEFQNGSVIRFLGLDKREKVKSIASVHCLFLEEADQFDLQDMNQLDIRLRDKYQGGIVPNFILHAFNPISTLNQLYERFFSNVSDNVKKQMYVLKTTYLNNSQLPAEYVNTLNNLKYIDQNYYNIYCLGEFGVLDRTVYRAFNIIDDANIPSEFDDCIWGLDFGYNNPTALVKIIIRDQNYFVKEYIYRSNMDNNELIELMKGIVPQNDRIFCDTADAARIHSIRLAGWGNASGSNKNVKGGIDYVKQIHSNICIEGGSLNLLKESKNYCWQKIGDKIVDQPLKVWDHALDAMRYALYTYHVLTS